MPARLAEIVKANDVRGLVPEQLDAGVAAALGSAFAQRVAVAEQAPFVLVGHDMRPSSPELVHAFAEGVAGAGVDVVVIGLTSTDGLYYASGALDAPAAMFTASHNPAAYNGIKFCRAAARPVGRDTGLPAIRDLAQGFLDGTAEVVPAPVPGVVSERDVLRDYSAFLRSLVELGGGRGLKVVVDAGNGMAGLTAPAVLGTAAGLEPLPLQLVPLYFELDGTFPHHEPNPLEPENLRDLQAAVLANAADIGLAFDGDADRCFVVDERGAAVSPSAITALIADREIARETATGAAPADVRIVHNVITSRAVPEIVAERGATPVRTRVGHSFIKEQMAAHGAVFGGEHSAHYYFRDFWFADTGMLAALHVLAALGEQDRPLSALMARYHRYVGSGEINSTVADVPAVLDRLHAYAAEHDAVVDRLDGLTVTAADGASWWFNVRSSNTEPLLRLNVEAPDGVALARVRDDVLAIIQGAP